MVDTRNEELRVTSMLEDVRALRMIDCITAALGRTSKLDPGSIFPSLKDASKSEDDDDDDVDPREFFQQFQAVNARRIAKPIRTKNE